MLCTLARLELAWLMKKVECVFSFLIFNQGSCISAITLVVGHEGWFMIQGLCFWGGPYKPKPAHECCGLCAGAPLSSKMAASCTGKGASRINYFITKSSYKRPIMSLNTRSIENKVRLAVNVMGKRHFFNSVKAAGE